jgi:hypothetical protein
MKVSLQSKIAELEQRIIALEERERLFMRQYSQQTISYDTSGVFGMHWDKMWEEFHLVMKAAFGK